MIYHSTGGGVEGRSFQEVVLEGAAPDGSLYLPDRVPDYVRPQTGSAHARYVGRALEAFGAGDVDDLVVEALSNFHHPEVAPLTELGDFSLLELFWGPTLSFKDHALQVLGRLFERYLIEKGETRTVLVATSGDTGSAAIEGFRGLRGVRVVVLYPSGMVSDHQRRQMTTVVDPNVTVIAVTGSFDDCQRLVKEAFRAIPGLASANSINWGRIAAQVGYHMATSARMGAPYDLVVPTGNFGNAYSAWLARRMGASIESIVIANNANRVLYDLAVTGTMRDGPAVATVAPAMDIQVPSNLERFLDDRDEASFASEFEAGWAGDETILGTIRRVYETHRRLIDPHTAAAWAVAEERPRSDVPTVVVSTAHPAKFAETIHRATGVTPEAPEWGRIDPELPERRVEIEPNFAALAAHL